MKQIVAVLLFFALSANVSAQGRMAGIMTKLRQAPVVERVIPVLTKNWGHTAVAMLAALTLSCGTMSCDHRRERDLIAAGHSYEGAHVAFIDTANGSLTGGHVTEYYSDGWMWVELDSGEGERISINSVVGLYSDNHEYLGRKVFFAAGLVGFDSARWLYGSVTAVYKSYRYGSIKAFAINVDSVAGADGVRRDVGAIFTVYLPTSSLWWDE